MSFGKTDIACFCRDGQMLFWCTTLTVVTFCRTPRTWAWYLESFPCHRVFPPLPATSHHCWTPRSPPPSKPEDPTVYQAKCSFDQWYPAARKSSNAETSTNLEEKELIKSGKNRHAHCTTVCRPESSKTECVQVCRSWLETMCVGPESYSSASSSSHVFASNPGKFAGFCWSCLRWFADLKTKVKLSEVNTKWSREMAEPFPASCNQRPKEHNP